MPPMRFLMNTGRTTSQGRQVSIGKDSPAYEALVATLEMHPEDMRAAGITPGARARVRSAHGEAAFTCVEGAVPRGMVFAPYGPPAGRLMGEATDGTGMPRSKGWEVEIAP